MATGGRPPSSTSTASSHRLMELESDSKSRDGVLNGIRELRSQLRKLQQEDPSQSLLPRLFKTGSDSIDLLLQILSSVYKKQTQMRTVKEPTITTDQLMRLQHHLEKIGGRCRTLESDVDSMESHLKIVRHAQEDKIATLKHLITQEKQSHRSTVEDLKNQLSVDYAKSEQRIELMTREVQDLKNQFSNQLSAQTLIHSQHQNATSTHIFMQQNLMNHITTELEPWRREIRTLIDKNASDMYASNDQNNKTFASIQSDMESLRKSGQDMKSSQTSTETQTAKLFESIQSLTTRLDQLEQRHQDFIKESQSTWSQQQSQIQIWIQKQIEEYFSQSVWIERQNQLHQQTADTLASITETLRLISHRSSDSKPLE